MSTISVSLPADGTTADVSDYNTPINTIVNEFNGNIDNANIKAGAAIATSKLADDAGITPAKWTNPYKFRVRRSTAQNTSAGAFAKVNFNTEDFDSNSNFDSTTNFRYTAPVAGFYQFNANVNVATPGTSLLISLYKNGSEYQRGMQFTAAAGVGAIFSDLVQSAANDYWEIFVFASNTTAITVAAGNQPVFSGFLVSQT